MAVVAKVAGNTLPLKVLTVMGVSAALVFGGYFVLDQWNRGIQRDTRRVETDITNAQFDLKREEMNIMETVRNNFVEYKHRAQLANVLFDFLPRGDLPQIMDELNKAAEMVRTHPDFSRGTFYGFDEVRWSGYNISLEVYASGDDFQSDFVDALHRLGFFDGIVYGGFTPVDGDLPDHISIPSNAPLARQFSLTLKIKGGHIYEQDGERFTR
jgi:hypothetical protein